ncbi:MAG: RNA 2',3'-cyclic phosphodiesterase, partial [Candidatus Marinimicrobia bacterium]|nr:RNA 2',3'-cyclic phosphodiesterase [Candidatus Neomarinimicrobiota bacterium]
MADKRTFIGIPLPGEIKEQLRVVQEVLEPVSDGVKWVDPDLLHITLKFLGETPERMLEAMREEFFRTVSGVEAFQLQIKQLGQFPKEGEPRVLWAGVQRIPGRLYKLSD